MQATYFDGRSARAYDVSLHIEDDRFILSGGSVDRREPVGAVEITDAIGSAPRVLRFADGASCEVLDLENFAAMLLGHGVAPSRVSVWEKNSKYAVAALVLVMAMSALAYRYGLPLMVRSATERLPPKALDSLSRQIQRVLDQTVFSRSRLDGRRQASLLNMFDALTLPTGTRASLRLDFRNAPTLGANAMALPSGVIFVTDQLVALTNDDRIVMAVVAHEVGHVARRHGLRQIIQSSVVGAFVTWYIGDVGALGAAAPTALLQAKYSRDLEREADAYAAGVLRANGMRVSLLADGLELLDRAQKARGNAGNADALVYLSSHPATAERLAWLRAEDSRR